MGVIRGAEPGPVLMLRADMDALPFRNDDGSIEAVHACGHDSHCAMVLAAASELADRVRRGTLKILFQPGEETLHGALEVLEVGRRRRHVDIALGCHVRPIQDIPTGTCAAAVRHTSSTFADIATQTAARPTPRARTSASTAPSWPPPSRRPSPPSRATPPRCGPAR